MWFIDMFLHLSNHGMNLNRLEIWGNCDVDCTCPGPFQVAFFSCGVSRPNMEIVTQPSHLLH